MTHEESGGNDAAALLRDASQRVWRQARDLAHIIDELRENLPGPMARVRMPARPAEPVRTAPAPGREQPWPQPRTAALAAGIAAGVAAVGVVVALSIRRRRD